ncbi:MAG: hypothetical protein A3F16_02980 [Deltaproteobacteria bacterium RIFCSPHIGHO2_12_FULL_43_9]|nr:MAG: hypothetical protein A3F16_02980 [Deltaproteobacteria bacterium RIFCSPHIGHO2_12_FULL_43_9]
MHYSPLLWIGFNLFVLVLLALDLGVFHKKPHAIEFKEAMAWSIIWVLVALLFNLGVLVFVDSKAALDFFTGYLIERSLSIDNIFVFLVIFNYFKVQPQYQHKVLFWGIIGALVMRGLFIWGGIALIERFHWTIYLFGAVLIYSGLQMALQKEKELDPEKNLILRIIKKILPFTNKYDGGKFLTHDGRRVGTLLLMVLCLIEVTDVIFALDSIPAILAITTDPFIVFTSNVFAILGLRALYFAFAHFSKLFYYLQFGLSGVLLFVGIKMVSTDFIKIPTGISLVIISVILGIAIFASVKWPPETKKEVFPRGRDS